MKRIIVLLLCLTILAVSFASCSSLKEGEKGASISVYLSEYPQTLDPALVQLNSDVSQVLGLIFETLTTIDENGKLKPALATKWYPVYDKITNEYKMKFALKDTQWSDKRAVSANDVIYAWKRILAPETESPYASMLYPIKNAKQVKAGTMTSDSLGLYSEEDTLLVVTFEQDYNTDLFAETVSNIHLAPVREDAVVRALKEDKPEDRDWAASAASIVCNGPFRVQALEEGVKLILERNTYYMRDIEDDALDKYVLPYRIVCQYQEDKAVKDGTFLTQIEYQTKRFKEEKIFYLSGFNKETYSEFKDDIESSVTSNSYVYYFNTNSQVLSKKEVRNALSLALDRNKIVNEITGTGEIAATGYIPNGVFDATDKKDFRTVGGNLYTSGTSPSDLLKQAGVSGGSFTLTYLIPESKALINRNKDTCKYVNIYEEVAKYAQSVWQDLGFEVTLKGLNPNDYIEALYNREFDVLGINNVMDSVDAFAYLAPFSKYYSGSAVSVDFEKEAFTTHYTNLEDKEY
ncbi:MAG TPA: hypothetical protein DD733_04375, partial [Clostridiales bacterium]|nr:hypothetical protein [Clostridiales bacterium]